MLIHEGFKVAAVAAGVFWLAAGTALATEAELRDPGGAVVGTVSMSAVPTGVLLRARLSGLPEGAHAFHVHVVGECEPPFSSAGGHYNPDSVVHGLEAVGGPHVGDMPNIHVPASGELEIEILNTQLALDDGLFDADGAAIVIHEGADDYVSDPAGDAGPRIACGVIRR